jgi:hypothetical protein
LDSVGLPKLARTQPDSPFVPVGPALPRRPNLAFATNPPHLTSKVGLGWIRLDSFELPKLARTQPDSPGLTLCPGRAGAAAPPQSCICNKFTPHLTSKVGLGWIRLDSFGLPKLARTQPDSPGLTLCPGRAGAAAPPQSCICNESPPPNVKGRIGLDSVGFGWICPNSPGLRNRPGSAPAPGAAADALVRRPKSVSASTPPHFSFLFSQFLLWPCGLFQRTRMA